MSLPKIVGGLASLAYLRNSRVKRVSSWDRTGGNRDFIVVKPGDTASLAKIKGTGAIRHIWITISCPDKYYLRKILFRAYWDGENKPSIDTPIGDFFGIGHGIAKHFISLPLTMTTDKGFNCYFPMPFRDMAEIEIVNECDTNIGAFYYHIDYELYDRLEENAIYFHAKWRRELVKSEQTKINLTGEKNYLILYAEGKGHYIGCVMSIHGLRPGWWGEGDDMIFVDGEKWPPSLHGTGTEDYFNAAWGFNREFYGIFHGFPLKGSRDWTGYHSMYRFHIEDPITFTKSIKVTIEHGHANDRGDDISSVAYWYQTEPHIDFSPMPKPEDRIPLPLRTPSEIIEDIIKDISVDQNIRDNYWKYVHWLNSIINEQLSIPRNVRDVLNSMTKPMWMKLIKLEKEENIRRGLIEIYESVLNSFKKNGK